MAVKIRLQRKGKRDQALYRLVVVDQHAKVNGKTIAILGSANPKTEPPFVSYDKEALEGWIKKGAQMSQTVRKLLSS